MRPIASPVRNNLQGELRMGHEKNSFSESYAKAGVDVTAGYRAVDLMKQYVARTVTAGVMDGIGGFGGLFRLDVKGMESPVLVSGTDGVGTKIKIAFIMDRHHTVGIDCVAMCVNDVICCGAKPLFFLDYIACGKNYPEVIEQIVSGVAEGCVQSGAALIGGETAEMPGFYPEDEYDLAGYCTGLVDAECMIDPQRVKEGDVIIALPSSGVHSNGFSLVRKVFDVDETDLRQTPSAWLHACGPDEDTPVMSGRTLGESATLLGDQPLGEVLLTPTKIYVRSIQALMEQVDVRGVSHITGGGFYENIPRAIPDGLCAFIDRKSVRILPVFDLIAAKADLSEKEMFSTFNCGVGMTVTVPQEQVDLALQILHRQGEKAYVIGRIGPADQAQKIVIG